MADIDLDAMTDEVIRRGFDPATVGRHLREIAESGHPHMEAVAAGYGAIVAKALTTRRQRAAGQRPAPFSLHGLDATVALLRSLLEGRVVLRNDAGIVLELQHEFTSGDLYQASASMLLDETDWSAVVEFVNALKPDALK